MTLELEVNTSLIQLLNCVLATVISLYGTQRNWRFATELLTIQCTMASIILLCSGFWIGQEMLILKAALLNLGLIAACVGAVWMLAPYRLNPETFISINERNGYRIVDRRSFG